MMDLCEVAHCTAEAVVVVTIIVGEVRLCTCHCRGILNFTDEVIPWQRASPEARLITPA